MNYNLTNYLNNIISRFPLSEINISSNYFIEKDIIEMISANVKSSHIDKLINGEKRQISNLCENNIMVEDFYTISNLNYHQLKAVYCSTLTDELIISGNKGSGKREILLNIISNKIIKGENVIIISENEGYFSSLSNRFGELDNLWITLSSDNEKEILDKLKSKITNNWSSSNNKTKLNINSKSKTIQRKMDSLKEMEEVLLKKRPFGLTLQEMYAKSSSINSSDDYRYKSYKNFTKNDSFHDITYTQIRAAVEKIDIHIIESYKNYITLVYNFPYLLEIKENSNINVFKYIDDNSKDIKNVFTSIFLNIKGLEYFSEISKLYIQSSNSIKSVDIQGLSKSILEKSGNNIFTKINNNKAIGLLKILGSKKGLEDEKKYANFITEIETTLETYNTMISKYLERISPLNTVLKENFYYSILKDSLSGVDVSLKISNLLESLKKFKLFKRYNDLLNELSPLQINILSFIYENTPPSLEERTLLNQIPQFSILSEIKKIESINEEKKLLFNYLKYDEIKNSIFSLRDENNKMTRKLVNEVYESSLYDLSQTPLYKEFKEYLGKEDININEILKKYRTIFFFVFPIIFATPEVVSKFFPLEKDVFSNCIFQNSCKIPLEISLPSIYRSKNIILTGNIKYITKEGSLLEKGINAFNEVGLKYDYSNQSKEILNFSNIHFYDNSLIISPSIINDANFLPIEVVSKDMAIGLISDLLMENNIGKFSIICFSKYIESEIRKDLIKNNIYVSNKDIIKIGEKSFDVEREIIFIFTSSLEKYGDNNIINNLFNLALSSAINKIYIIGDKAYNCPIVEEFIKYGENLKEYKSINNIEENSLKTKLQNELENLDYKIKSDLGTTPYLDICIYDEKKMQYSLGIICDNTSSYSSLYLEKDLSIIDFYESKGWNISRVWSRDWWLDKSIVINNINKKI